MDDTDRSTVYIFTAIILLSFAGCSPLALSPYPDSPHTITAGMTDDTREKRMNDHWTGKSYNELVEQLGKPKMVMSIPRDGWPASSAIHYGASGPPWDCVDSFLVLHGDREGRQAKILGYFCR